jgi:tetratricopeptide (TPR) repeat protein
MAKTPSDKLFRIIQSLSPAEKRYFRIFIRGKTERDSKYLQLFEAICTMPVFDEEALKTKIYKSQQTVEGKKYSELKAYLYELILKCLQSYDEQQSVEYKLNHLLQSVSALFKRGHYQDCEELLYKAGKIARQYEYFTHVLEIIRWQKQLAYTRMDVDYLHKHLEQLQFEEDRALEQQRVLSGYRKAFFHVYTVAKREAQERGSDRVNRLRELIDPEAFADPGKATSHKARVMFYRTLNIYHYAALELEQFYETGKKLIDLIESQPHFLKENMSDYIAGLSNLILSCGMLEHYDEVRQCLLKLRNLTPVTEDDRRKIHRQYFTGIFGLCIYTGEFAEARREIDRCQQEAESFDSHEYETASFFSQYCIICLGCGDYDSALGYLNQWMNQPRTVEREDLQSLARILSLILHFEMGNVVLLESLLRSALRFLQKKNRLFDLERRFIHLMSELVRLPSAREWVSAFVRMRSALQSQAAQPGVAALLQMFDLDSWLESKISGQSFAEVVKKKWKQD